jgi:hypothetical protein
MHDTMIIHLWLIRAAAGHSPPVDTFLIASLVSGGYVLCSTQRNLAPECCFGAVSIHSWNDKGPPCFFDLSGGIEVFSEWHPTLNLTLLPVRNVMGLLQGWGVAICSVLWGTSAAVDWQSMWPFGDANERSIYIITCNNNVLSSLYMSIFRNQTVPCGWMRRPIGILSSHWHIAPFPAVDMLWCCDRLCIWLITLNFWIIDSEWDI